MNGEKDRKMIWDDCPQCAYKHLAAAYAAFTSGVSEAPDGGVYVPTDRVLYARSHILKRESEAGYPGNLAAAIGCLALAESCMRGDKDFLTAGMYRNLRLHWSGETPPETPVDLVPSLTELAAAHMAEASRELPEMRGMFLERFFSEGSMIAGDLDQVTSALRGAIRWVEETFSVGQERIRA